MDRRSNTRALVEASLLTAIAVILILASIYVPAFMLVGLFIWPLPITLIYLRHGVKYSLLSLVITAILTAIMSDPVTAIGLVAVNGLLGVVLGYCITRKRTVPVTIVIMSAAAFISSMAVLKLFSFVTGQDIISQGINMMMQGYASAKQMYISLGVPKETVEKTMAMFPSADIIRKILPSGFIAYSVFTAFICYILAQKIFKRFKYSIREVKPLSEWYIPAKLAVGIISILLICYLLLYFKVQNSEMYFLNANLIFNYVFTINGLAFAAAFLKKNVAAGFLRIILLIFCILPPIGNFLYLIGIFDYIIDFRKLDPFRRRPVE